MFKDVYEIEYLLKQTDRHTNRGKCGQNERQIGKWTDEQIDGKADGITAIR